MKDLYSNSTMQSDTSKSPARTVQPPGLEMFESFYRENPYRVLGAAAAVGYVAAGGLATAFTRRLIRIGMKTLFVPVATAHLKELALGSDDEIQPLNDTDNTQ